MKLAFAAVAGAGVVLVGVVLAVGQRSGDAQDPYVGSEAPGRIVLPRFALRDHDGSLVRSSDLRGRVVVLTFLDTECTEACPIIAADVARGWRLLSAGERQEAVAVAITTDPRNDSPASIRAFLRRHRALGALRYLVGPLPELERLWDEFQILSSFESGDADTHSAPVRIYSRDGVWLATLHAGADLTPRSLAHDVRAALRS